MFRIIGHSGKDLCDSHLKPSRRDVLRVGGAGMLGLSLSSLLKLQAAQASARGHAGRRHQATSAHSRWIT